MKRPEDLGDAAREATMREIEVEETHRLGAFALPFYSAPPEGLVEVVDAEWDADIAAEKQRIRDKKPRKREAYENLLQLNGEDYIVESESYNVAISEYENNLMKGLK